MKFNYSRRLEDTDLIRVQDIRVVIDEDEMCIDERELRKCIALDCLEGLQHSCLVCR